MKRKKHTYIAILSFGVLFALLTYGLLIQDKVIQGKLLRNVGEVIINKDHEYETVIPGDAINRYEKTLPENLIQNDSKLTVLEQEKMTIIEMNLRNGRGIPGYKLDNDVTVFGKSYQQTPESNYQGGGVVVGLMDSDGNELSSKNINPNGTSRAISNWIKVNDTTAVEGYVSLNGEAGLVYASINNKVVTDINYSRDVLREWVNALNYTFFKNKNMSDSENLVGEYIAGNAQHVTGKTTNLARYEKKVNRVSPSMGTSNELKEKSTLQAIPWGDSRLKTVSYGYQSYLTVSPEYLDNGYYTDDGKVVLEIVYYEGGSNPSMINTIQVFDDVTGELLGAYTSSIQNYKTQVPFKLYKELSTKDTVFFMEYDGEISLLKAMDLVTFNVETVREFPKKTSLELTVEEEDISFYGSVGEMSGDFSGYDVVNDGSHVVIGKMASLNDVKPLRVKSLTNLPANDSVTFSSSMRVSDTKIMVTGFTKSTNFTDIPPANARFITGFYGLMIEKVDYPPGINKLMDIIVDIEDKELNSSSKIRDNWLLSGTKKGNLSDPLGIVVYDTRDLSKNSSISGDKQKWLDSRINRNPSDISLPIDWNELGFDISKRGPQQVKYFISDSQKQITSTSRWINRVDNETSYDLNAAISASNFSVNIDEVDGLKISEDINKMDNILSLSNVTAWIFETGVEETFNLDKVSVDQTQLSRIKNAKNDYYTSKLSDNTNILKPYPLNIKYKYESEKTVSRTIQVFVTKENTIVDNEVVLYADNFSLSLREAAISTENSLLKKNKFKQTQPNVVVYDYMSQPQDDDQLQPLSKGKTDGTVKGLSVENDSLLKVINATKKQIISDFQFSYTNPADAIKTVVKVDVTIDDTSEFCFKLERTEDELRIVEPINDNTMDDRYQAIEIRVPLNQEIKEWDILAIPAGWFKFQNSSTDDYHSYGFSIKNKNDLITIQAFLEDLRFIINDTIDAPGEIEIIFREKVYTSFEHPDGTIHYYTFDKKPTTWQNAYNSSKNMRYKGLTGYLTTITSSEEHVFIYDNIAKKPGWLGGTRMVKSTGVKIEDDTDISLSQVDYNVATNIASKWYWTNGPEAGMVFYNTATRSATGPISGVYSDWYNPKEPNNRWHWGEAEYVLQFAKSGTKEWNDIYAHNVEGGWNEGYYTEFSQYGNQQETEYDELDVYCSADVPQKVYIKGKDDQGNALNTGDKVLETKLRIGKEFSFEPITIPWYDYVNLTKVGETVITPETFTIEGTKQEANAIYTQTLTTLHIRQVVLDSEDTLVVPIRGEGNLTQTTTLGGTVKAELPMVYPTRDDTSAGFKTVTYDVATAEPFYTVSPVLPEYYQYVGYVLTATNVPHSASNKQSGHPKWDIRTQPEVWVTVYLTPNASGGTSPGLYGWHYGDDGSYTIIP